MCAFPHGVAKGSFLCGVWWIPLYGQRLALVRYIATAIASGEQLLSTSAKIPNPTADWPPGFDIDLLLLVFGLTSNLSIAIPRKLQHPQLHNVRFFFAEHHAMPGCPSSKSLRLECMVRVCKYLSLHARESWVMRGNFWCKMTIW